MTLQHRRPPSVPWPAATLALAVFVTLTYPAAGRDATPSPAATSAPPAASASASGQDQLRAALSKAAREVEAHPGRAQSALARSELRQTLGDAAGAREDFERAMWLSPEPEAPADVPPEIVQRDRAATEAVQQDASPENLHRLALIRHERAFAILDHPETAPDQRALEEAVAYARSATVLEPGDPGHWLLAGLLYAELSKTDERALPMIEAMLEEATEVDPEYAPAWLELGLTMAQQARGMAAISALEKAIESDPAATAESAVGPLCAMYAANDEGLRGVDFFQEQYAANPEVPALGLGNALMLDYLGDRQAARSQANDLLVVETEETPVKVYAQKLLAEWEAEQ